MSIDRWGESGQKKIEEATVGIAGSGGLGTPVATYLTAAGVGRITICDDQTVELSNLNRQTLFSVADIGRLKVEAAAATLHALNPSVGVKTVPQRITASSVSSLFDGCDLIVDCLDNLETRFVLNRFCVERSVPLFHAGVRGFYGQVMLVKPPESPCLECFIEPRAPVEGPVPICGATAGVVGSLQASMVLRYLIDPEQVESGVFHSVDLEDISIHDVRISRRAECPVCGQGSR